MKSNWMSSNGIKEKRGERLRQTESAGGGRAKTTMIKWTLAAVIIGFLIDLAVGDPRWLYHPIRAIGNLIALLEKILRRCFPKGRAGERTAGVILVVLTVAVSTAVPLLILYFAHRINEWLGFVLETLMCYQLPCDKGTER